MHVEVEDKIKDYETKNEECINLLKGKDEEVRQKT